MGGHRVYVGGLPYGARERDLERFFKGYGRTKDILIKNGYGFVEFEDQRDADDAVYELNGKELMSDKYAKKVTVEVARGTANHNGRYDGGNGGHRGGYGGNNNGNRGFGERFYGPAFSTEFRLYVKNLSSRVNWKDLKDYMRQAGEVTYADAHKQHRNEGVVEFASIGDMKNALETLNDTELNGRRIRLIEDKPKSGRGGRKGGRSKSGSRSRSRSPQRKSSKSADQSRSKSKTSRSQSRSRQSEGNTFAASSPAISNQPIKRSADKTETSKMSRSPLDEKSMSP